VRAVLFAVGEQTAHVHLAGLSAVGLALGVFLAASGWEKSVWTKGGAIAAFLFLAAANYVLVPRIAESRSPLCDAEPVLVLGRDPAVPVICHPRLLNSVAFALGRDDLRGFRGKEMQEMIEVLRRQPRTLVWFSQISCQESLRRLLPADLEMTHTARLGLCAMAVIERKQYTNRGTARLFEAPPMKLGIMANSIVHLGWDKALAYCQQLGLKAIEIPCGAYPKKHLFDPEQVLADPSAQQRIKDDVARHGLVISALSCHGNAIHPDRNEARRHEQAQDVAVRLAPNSAWRWFAPSAAAPAARPATARPIGSLAYGRPNLRTCWNTNGMMCWFLTGNEMPRGAQ